MSNNNKLKEVAKFVSGLVTADFLIGVWCLGSGILSFNFLGITFTQPMIIGWMIVDVIIFISLVYYA